MNTSSPVSVAVIGALGKMGREVVKTVLEDPGLTLAAAVDRVSVGEDVAQAMGRVEPCGVILADNLEAMLAEKKPQVCVDFTRPDVVLKNALTIAQAASRPLIGTTGLNEQELGQINDALKASGVCGAVIPNFAIGAVLMMKFAQEASKYFDHAEIVELHHNRKLDAPSGTSTRTAEMMAEGLKSVGKTHFGQTNIDDHEVISGARGGTTDAGIHIHSVRVPGYVASQEVIFGDVGQTFKIRHDSIDRQCFMPGVALAAKKLMEQPAGLVIGLENLMD